MLNQYNRWLFHHRIRKWNKRVIAARIQGPPLGPPHETHARRLAELGPSALGDSRDEVREIGELLNHVGGMSLMKAAVLRADSLSLQRDADPVLRKIAVAWDGIGDWMV
jgi:hypothetical protein